MQEQPNTKLAKYIIDNFIMIVESTKVYSISIEDGDVNKGKALSDTFQDIVTIHCNVCHRDVFGRNLDDIIEHIKCVHGLTEVID